VRLVAGAPQQDDGDFEEDWNDGQVAEELDELMVVVHHSFCTSPPVRLTMAVAPLSVKMTLTWLLQEPRWWEYLVKSSLSAMARRP